MPRLIGTDSTECPICMEEYRDPRYLPCRHTFCTPCIQQLINTHNPLYITFLLRVFRCPLCRNIVEVPARAAKGFPRDVKVDEHMADIGEVELSRRRDEKLARRRAEELADTTAKQLAESRANLTAAIRDRQVLERRLADQSEESKSWRLIHIVCVLITLGLIYATNLHFRNQSAFDEERATSSEKIQRLNRNVQDLTDDVRRYRMLTKVQQETIDEYEPKYDVALTKTYELKPAGSRAAALMTLIDGKLLIANAINGELKLRDAYSVTKESNWTTVPSSTVAGMGVCPKNGQVFVSTWNKYIYRFHRDGEMMDHWPVDALASGMISVTNDCNVVLAVRDYSGTILIYSTYGELINEIRVKLHISESRLIKAVPLSKGGFIVSYGEGDDPVHGIDIINANGKSLKSYGGRNDPAASQLNLPRDFAVDRFGNILVVDSGNKRILLLDSQLIFQRELLSTKYGLQHPFGILLNECETRLYVTDNEWGPTRKKWTNGRIMEFRTK